MSINTYEIRSHAMDPQYPAYGYYEDEFGYDNNNPGHMAQGTTGGFYEGVNGYGDFEYGQDTQGISGVPVAPVQGGNAIYTVSCESDEDQRQENIILTMCRSLLMVQKLPVPPILPKPWRQQRRRTILPPAPRIRPHPEPSSPRSSSSSSK